MRVKIAVIGAGISGIGAALALADQHDVRLFEKDGRFGGHAHTNEIDYDGVPMRVDTGFIVFNTKNYPNLCALFEHLKVPSENSNMTFSVSTEDGALEYACTSLKTVFAQRWRLADPRFWAVFAEILRFNRTAKAWLAASGGAGDHESLSDWLDRERFSARFRDAFLYPMGGAIWSTPSGDIGDFPARAFIQFFVNHELLNGFRQEIVWRTVSGGSRAYVDRALQALGPRAQAGVGAVRVERLATGQVRVRFADGSDDVFDHVVLATHSDQALALLAEPGAEERRLLSAVRYAPNVAVLHRDPSLMPQRRAVWSSWNFRAARIGAAVGDGRPPAVSYWMNRLQNLDPARPLFVTLNPTVEPDPALTFARHDYAHPQFDAAAFDAQTRMDAVQGAGGVWYAGAWLGWGFHEDGLSAGLRVAAALGARPSWAVNLDDARLRPPLAIAAE
ncbi:MAG: FAD-dependent oxidoreductase [Pseudomonadota bacterium]